MTTSGPPVALERHGPGVVHLTLDRPSRGNLLDAAVLDALEEHLAGLAADQEVAVAVLRGRGPDFCLGRDRGVGGPPPPAKVFAGLDQVQRVNQALGAFPGISVAGVRGRALGAGASLAARCDLVVAADTARLAFPEVHDAIAPMIVMSHFGKVLPEKPFLDLVLTGREVSADEAQRIGLVSRVVPEQDLEPAVEGLTKELAATDRETLRLCKAFYRRLGRMDTEDAAAYGVALTAVVLGRS